MRKPLFLSFDHTHLTPFFPSVQLMKKNIFSALSEQHRLKLNGAPLEELPPA